MTLKQFLIGKTLNSVELTTEYNLIFNVYVDDQNTPYGLDIDCSNVPAGTILTRTTDFTLENDILSVDDISIDINEVNMLSDEF